MKGSDFPVSSLVLMLKMTNAHDLSEDKGGRLYVRQF